MSVHAHEVQKQSRFDKYEDLTLAGALVLISGYFALYGLWWPEQVYQYHVGWLGNILFTVGWFGFTDNGDDEDYEETPTAAIVGPVVFCWLMAIFFGFAAVGWYYWQLLHLVALVALVIGGITLWLSLMDYLERKGIITPA